MHTSTTARNCAEGLGAACRDLLTWLMSRYYPSQSVPKTGSGRAAKAVARPGFVCPAPRRGMTRFMLMDIVIAVVIVAIAAALGITVHPLLWLIVIIALIWVFARRSSW